MVRVLSTIILVSLFIAEFAFANLCHVYFSQEVRTVQDFKGVVEYALDNHAYYNELNTEVLGHFVQELPKYMDPARLIFRESDIARFVSSEEKMTRRIERDLENDGTKRMDVLFARYQMRIAQVREAILKTDQYKNEIIDRLKTPPKTSLEWGKTEQDVLENAKEFMVNQMRVYELFRFPLEDAYSISKRMLDRYLTQWERRPDGSSALPEIMSRSFVSGLDPFSEFISRREILDDVFRPSVRFLSGIAMLEGVQGILVTEVLKGSPAEKAGIRPGDVIVGLQGERFAEITPREFQDKINSYPKAEVEFRITRDRQEFEVRLERKELVSAEAPSVAPQTVVTRHGQLVSVRIEKFSADSSRRFVEDLHQVFQKGPVAGITIDLRGNPGGYVHEALQVLKVFLSNQPVIIYNNRKKGQEPISLGRDHPTVEIPLVVLVNEGSASAAEMVSGALQSENRAIIVGAQTFGKGTAHAFFSHNYGGIQLTNSFFHFSNGESPQLEGVRPDILIRNSKTSETRASDLEHALPAQKISALDRSEYSDAAREKLFTSVRNTLLKRSEVRQKAGLNRLNENIDAELSEAFYILTDWAELLAAMDGRL